MRLRRKILYGAGAVLVVGISGLLIALSHESPCPQTPALAEGVDSMRAITHRCYGDPGTALALERIPKPVPGESEVLIRIHAASVNPFEWHTTTGKPYFMRLGSGFGTPKGSMRVGYDMAGTVEAIGAKVTRFKVGDEVFGGAHGALAEYALASENGDLVLKPPGVSFEQAAGILIAGGTALEALRDYGHIAPGQKVLVNGASGGVGTYAVQLAKSFGAEVTAVCSTRNVELVRSLGADHVIDYTKQNFTQGDEKFDLIVDNVGNHDYLDLIDVVKPTGIIVTVSGPKSNSFLGPMTRILKQTVLSPFVEPQLVFFVADVDAPDLEFMAGLMREGKLTTVIDRRFALEEAGAALDYIGSQRARGKVIVTPAP